MKVGKKKKARILKQKNGPQAYLAESMYVGTKRHFWAVVAGFAVSVEHSPKKAKETWRQWNASAWQKKTTPTKGENHEQVEPHSQA